MSKLSVDTFGEFYAQTYDASVLNWRGEMEFYKALVDEAAASGRDVLELACGTGRVALEMAGRGVKVVGLDRSGPMLEVAKSKSEGVIDIEWVQADMRTFELNRQFGLIIIPGHAFQNLLGPSDQLACLERIKGHLILDGVVVIHLDHQDVDWLGELMGEKAGKFEPAEEFLHPRTGQKVRASRAWWYERSVQAAIVQTIWEVVDVDGTIVGRIDSGQIKIHCVFPFEMEHLLGRAGFQCVELYGDFNRSPLNDESDQMIWVAKKAPRLQGK